MIGIPKIKIPLKRQDVALETVAPYVDSVFAKFNENRHKIRENYDIYCLKHDVLHKERVHDDTEINNIVLIPQIRAMVDWKTGYEFGNPIKYAQIRDNDTDDIQYLNKYIRNSDKRSVDKAVGTWVHATGVGYYFIEPKSYDFDMVNDSPFDIYCRPADTCTKVYSSYGGGEELFDILFTEVEEYNQQNVLTRYYVVDLYLNNALYTFKSTTIDNAHFALSAVQKRGLYTFLPLVEKRANEDGIGISEMGREMQNALDNMISNGMDNIEEVVNEIYVYKGVSLGNTLAEKSNTHRQMKKAGAIELPAPQADQKFAPDVDILQPEVQLNNIIDMYNTVNEAFHNTIGVPLETSNTNSGGTTKQGSEVANGYDNAYNRAIDDINTFYRADNAVLNRILWICKNTPGNKINDIASSDIDIKYSLNMSDNILTKSQSYGTFIVTMPPAMALRLCRLSSDPEAEGKLIEEHMQRKAEEAMQQANETVVGIQED
jgi:hypothetical protein